MIELRRWANCIVALFFLGALSQASGKANQQPNDLPSVSDSISFDEMSVTLLDARRLSADEYRLSRGATPDLWLGGGFHFAFLVQNRPGQPIPPVLGETRVLIGSQLYNLVTNSNSSKPLAPFIHIHVVEDFFNNTVYGRSIRKPLRPSPGGIADILEIYIRGEAVPGGATGVVELSQGATHLPDGPLRHGPRADEIVFHWFRFRLPPLD